MITAFEDFVKAVVFRANPGTSALGDRSAAGWTFIFLQCVFQISVPRCDLVEAAGLSGFKFLFSWNRHLPAIFQPGDMCRCDILPVSDFAVWLIEDNNYW